MCDHSQGVYFPSNHRRWSIILRVLFQQTNKKKKSSGEFWKKIQGQLELEASGKKKNRQHTRPSQNIKGRPEELTT